MTFDKILDDKRLWAVKYDGEKANCFDQLFSTWYDMNWLRSFFQENLADLSSYFHITDVYEAVMETIDEAKRLECDDGYNSGCESGPSVQTSRKQPILGDDAW